MNAGVVKILALKKQQQEHKLQQTKDITKQQISKLELLKSHNFADKNHENAGILGNYAKFKQNLFYAIKVQQQQIMQCHKNEQQSLYLYQQSMLKLQAGKKLANCAKQKQRGRLNKIQQNNLQQLANIKSYLVNAS